MKQVFLLIISIFFLAGCSDSSVIKNNGNEQTILLDTVENSLDEKNFKAQMKEYVVAFHKGDADVALSYIYPDLFEYFKIQFKGQNISAQTIKDSAFFEPMKKMREMNQDNKVEFEFVIGDVSKKVQYKKYKLFKAIHRINFTMGLDNHSFGEEVIGISNDEGVTWKFIANDPETLSGILRLRFPKHVIDELSKQ